MSPASVFHLLSATQASAKLGVDASTVAVGMMMSLSIGSFDGLIPVMSAMRLSALVALR
jgi:hypothetical protein